MKKNNLDPQKKWIKENKKKLGCSFDAKLIDDFKIACEKLGIDQSPIIKKAMEDTIKEAEEMNLKF